MSTRYDTESAWLAAHGAWKTQHIINLIIFNHRFYCPAQLGKGLTSATFTGTRIVCITAVHKCLVHGTKMEEGIKQQHQKRFYPCTSINSYAAVSAVNFASLSFCCRAVLFDSIAVLPGYLFPPPPRSCSPLHFQYFSSLFFIFSFSLSNSLVRWHAYVLPSC